MKLIRMLYTDELRTYGSPLSQESVLGVPPTKMNQQQQQSPIGNTFTSIELLTLSLMENQHEREKGKHKTINA